MNNSSDRKLNVLMLLSYVGKNGVTKHTLDLTKGLTDLGHNVTLVTGGIRRESENNPGVQRFYQMFQEMNVDIRQFKNYEGTRIMVAWSAFTSTIKILRWIVVIKPDVIHAQSPYWAIFPWLLRKKFTTTIHAMCLKKNFFLKTPTHVIAISKESQLDSMNKYGLKEDRVSIVHHGVSDYFSNPISEEEKKKLKLKHKLPQDKIYLGFVGQLLFNKGYDILIKAMQSLSPEAQQKIHCVFLGDLHNSPRANELKEAVRKAGLESVVTHVEFEDPKPFYDLFDIFILPSRSESFPLVTLESMMSGCCSIRSNVEGSREQIDDAVNGFIFESENHAELSEILEKLIFDDDLRKRIGASARQKALEKFTIPRMTKDTLKIYELIQLN